MFLKERALSLAFLEEWWQPSGSLGYELCVTTKETTGLCYEEEMY